MNRLILLAVALVSMASICSEAQMRGGFAGGGFRGGGFRGGAGFRGGGGFVRPAPPVRFGGGITTFRGSPGIVVGGRVGFVHNPHVHVFFGNHFGNRRVFFKRHFVSTFPFGAGFSSGFGYLPYYPYYADYPSTVEPAPASYSQANDNAYEQGRIAQQLQDLRDEVSALREETVAGNRGAPEYQAAPEKPKTESLPPTTLVFRDGHHEDVQNYAIIGDTLWILSESRARKRPLSDIDVESTKKANAERGIEFSVPKARH